MFSTDQTKLTEVWNCDKFQIHRMSFLNKGDWLRLSVYLFSLDDSPGHSEMAKRGGRQNGDNIKRWT